MRTPVGSSLSVLRRRRALLVAFAAGSLVVASGVGESSSPFRHRGDRCLAFDGVNDLVTIPAAPSLAYEGQGGWSMDLWIKPTAYPTGETAILVQESVNVPGHDPYAIRVYPTHFAFCVEGKQGKRDEIAFDLPIGEWSHVAATYDADGHDHTMSVYVNGELIESRPTPVHMEKRIDPVRLGNVGREYGQPFFTGMIDDLHLWSRALSADEVGQLMRLAGGPYWRSAPDFELKLWLDFNASSDFAQVLLDNTLFKNHAILGTPDRSPNDAAPAFVLHTPWIKAISATQQGAYGLDGD